MQWSVGDSIFNLQLYSVDFFSFSILQPKLESAWTVQPVSVSLCACRYEKKGRHWPVMKHSHSISNLKLCPGTRTRTKKSTHHSHSQKVARVLVRPLQSWLKVSEEAQRLHCFEWHRYTSLDLQAFPTRQWMGEEGALAYAKKHPCSVSTRGNCPTRVTIVMALHTQVCSFWKLSQLWGFWIYKWLEYLYSCAVMAFC